MKTIQIKNKLIYGAAGLFIAALFSVVSCKKVQSSTTSALSLTNQTDTIPNTGGTISFSFTSNSSWTIDTAGFGWLTVSQISGNNGSSTIHCTAAKDSTGASHSVQLYVTFANGQGRQVTVYQDPVIYPSFNTSPVAPDNTGMGSTAAQLLSNIKLACNLFNTFEAHQTSTYIPYTIGSVNGETAWGSPYTTQAEIDMMKSAGFNAIRIPCAWHIHMNPATGVIDTAWLGRVKQVVQYCVNDNMYVLLNCHSDDGFLDCGATGATEDTVKAIQKAIWEQVATTMRDFDEHLMFAGANEPANADYRYGAKGTPNPNVTQQQAVATLWQYLQIFINAVRSTGGKNAYRTLVVQGFSGSGDLIDAYTPNGIPGPFSDQVANQLAIEYHYYTPYQFCILGDGTPSSIEWCFWGANYHTSNPALLQYNCQANEEGYMDSTVNYTGKTYVSQKMPVLIGEYDCQGHNNTLTGYTQDSTLSRRSQEHFRAHFIEAGKRNNIPVFLWASDVFDRSNNVVGDPILLDSLQAASGQ
jgi:aryl-phospho-beta-D-glucosidase BglC (GH1 family)